MCTGMKFVWTKIADQIQAFIAAEFPLSTIQKYIHEIDRKNPCYNLKTQILEVPIRSLLLTFALKIYPVHLQGL